MNDIQDDFESFPVISEDDKAILMHRDVHFGGKFPIMLDYYLKGGKGVFPDFEIARIQELQVMEDGLKQNLAALMLSGSDAERVAQAKEAYKKLRDLYEKQTDKSLKYSRLMADLILSEEEEADAEVEAVVTEKGAIVPALMNLLRSEDFHDPLFPGYGLSPALAIKCLGLIGDKRAIISLFESIGNEEFFNEELSLKALYLIGEPAKEFLLKVLHARPITFDNERAAMALIQFKSDLQVSTACLEMLRSLDLKKQTLLATYLILACEDITDSLQRKELLNLAEDSNTPASIRQDIKTISKNWKNI